MTTTELPPLTNLSPITEQRGGDPTLVGEELLYHIEAGIQRHPRSLQIEAGPSDLGSPCTRKLGYLLSKTPKVNNSIGWLPAIGTAMHTQLDEWFAEANMATTEKRWLLGAAFRLDIGQVNGEDITGHGDIYDRVTAGVIDWKLVGKSTLDTAKKAQDPGEKYKVQTQLYGDGWIRRGLPVDYVAVMFLPRNALSLRDAYFWHQPYDPTIGAAAIAKADALAAAMNVMGPAAILPQLNTADDFCSGCPWYRAGSDTPSTACAGSEKREASTTRAKKNATAGLIPAM